MSYRIRASVLLVYSLSLIFWLSKIETTPEIKVRKVPPPALSISAPRTVFVKCFNEVSLVVLEDLSPGEDWKARIEEDIPYLCNWSHNRGLDPLLVAAVTRVESTWIRFDKPGPYGTGYMQVIGFHARRHGLTRKNLLDPETNFRIGTEVMILHKANLKNPSGLSEYNGFASPGYREEVMRIYRKYRRTLDRKFLQ